MFQIFSSEYVIGPIIDLRDNGFYDEAGYYLTLECKLQRLIVKITISG